MPIISIEVNGKMKTPNIDSSCWISESAWIIGDVTMGPDNVVYQGVIIRGDFAEVKIGAKNVFQDACIINTAEGFKTTIGDNNLIGFGAIVHGTTVKNNSVVGIKSVLMIAVTVEDDSMVGATSFVGMSKKVPAGQKWIGRELKGDNTQGKMWEAGRQSWRKMGLAMKNQKGKP
ncbi:MAG: gamma carbonic anhydrase family protein [Promethearchaeota archaeon]|jgi:carbonic anhydrase/acetyltransferase-like protein (isoleucine patch superfamily)